MKKIALINAHIIDPAQKINKVGSIIIDKKKVSKLVFTKKVHFNKETYNILDCKNLVLCPGFIDLKCHLRVPGQEYKENLSYASKSAASAGITSLVCMPNTDPIIDNVSIVELLQRKARKESDVKIFSTAAITKKMLGKRIN